MLMQKIKDWATGWVAGGILGLIIITFAVWGVNFGGQDIQLVAASVNGKDIGLRRFQQTYANFREQRQKYTNTPLTLDQEEQLKKDALDSLVELDVIYQAAVNYGLRISSEKVREVIKDIDAFGSEDIFDLDIYQNIITRLGMSPAVFEDQIRSELIANQLQSVIRDSVFVPKKEATQLTRISKQQRDLAYTILPANELKDSIQIDDDAVEQFYASTSEGLLSVEQIKITYLELSVEKLAQGILVDEEELSLYYDNNKDKYDAAEQRKVNIVDIKLSPNATDDEVIVATSKAEKIRALIASGTSFTDIAEQHDDGSKPEMLVSEHGYLAKGVLPEEVDEIVFSMDEGELSDIERTDSGLHIFLVTDIKGGIKNTLEYAREEVEKDYKRAQAEHKYYDLADQLVTSAYEHPETLEVAAEIVGIDMQESDFFSRENATGLLANPKVLAAGFNKAAIESRQNSEAIELNNAQLIILQVLDHLPSEKKNLEDVREQITETLKSEKASKIQWQKGQDILVQLKQGIVIAEVSETFEFEWQHVDAVARDDVSVNSKVLRTAFKLGKPAADDIVFGGTEIGKEDYAVVIVLKVLYSDTVVDEDIDSSQSMLLQLRANTEWSLMLDELMDQASISINSRNL